MKILAVVVTHNRQVLLARCISHLKAQHGGPPDILVIDNASVDDTADFLRESSVDFVTQDNVGSAGGWHRGIIEALTRGYDAAWLMDDDGYPDSGALMELRRFMLPDVACASSVVMQEGNPEKFVFPFPRLDEQGLPRLFSFPRKVGDLVSLQALSKAGTYPFAHLFNGALISLDAVRKVGNVNRDYFIFGDEVDYFFRLRCAGQVISVLDARHYHPDVTKRPYSHAKVYYYVKNTLILNRRYFDWVLLRNALTLLAAVMRTFQRNGIEVGLSYLVGSNARILVSAVRRGVAGQIGKDFDG